MSPNVDELVEWPVGPNFPPGTTPAAGVSRRAVRPRPWPGCTSRPVSGGLGLTAAEISSGRSRASKRGWCAGGRDAQTPSAYGMCAPTILPPTARPSKKRALPPPSSSPARRSGGQLFSEPGAGSDVAGTLHPRRGATARSGLLNGAEGLDHPGAHSRRSASLWPAPNPDVRQAQGDDRFPGGHEGAWRPRCGRSSRITGEARVQRGLLHGPRAYPTRPRNRRRGRGVAGSR